MPSLRVRTRTLTAIGIGLFGLSLLSGCAESKSGLSLGDLEHVHSVATDGERFFLASHHGLYVLSGDSWDLRGEEMDLMGFSISEGIYYGSGHPGPGQNLPDPLGILVSDDGGQSWSPDGLTGEVDFHLLKVSGQTMVGVAANYGIVISSLDGGQTWSQMEAPSLTSLALNPDNGKEMLLASEGVLLKASEVGKPFEPVATPTTVNLIEWSDGGIYYATKTAIFLSPESEVNFTALSKEFNNISALAADAGSIIVMDDQGVHISKDSGTTFELLT